MTASAEIRSGDSPMEEMPRSTDKPIPIVLRQGDEPRGAPWDDAVTLTAIGDLMLSGEWDEVAARGGIEAALADLGALGERDDLVFANLETAALGNAGLIPKEPRVVAEVDVLARALRTVGADLVNVANNHTYEAYRAGFETARQMLETEGILHLGAGDDAERAGAPVVLKRRGVRFGWLAYCDRGTKPSHVVGERPAGDEPAEGEPVYGINPLDGDRARREVAELAPEVDHVVVSLHWGVEYCHIPSPDQIALARSLVDAGARLVVSHHAHVVQGIETWGDGVITYNLGNATTTDHYVGERLAIRQTPRTRSSFVLRAAFDTERLLAVEAIPIRSERGVVLVDDAVARGILEEANRRLARGVTPELWKRTRLYEDVLLRTVRKLDPRVIRSLRPRHLMTFGKNLLSAARGKGPI